MAWPQSPQPAPAPPPAAPGDAGFPLDGVITIVFGLFPDTLTEFADRAKPALVEEVQPAPSVPQRTPTLPGADETGTEAPGAPAGAAVGNQVSSSSGP